MGYWECDNCGEDKCTRSGEFLQPINCTMYSWRKPKWKEVHKTPNTKESSNSIDNTGSPKFAQLVAYIERQRNPLTGEVLIPDTEWRKLRACA